MIINHNIAALNTYNKLATSQGTNSKSLEKLSSGLRINRAGDDAAGLAISEKMRGQIRGLDQAGRNAQDGISLIQTAEGALNETHSILQRMRELAVQSGNDTNTNNDRAEIQKEVNQLTDEIDRISSTTEFNTKKLINGNLKGIQTSTVSTVSVQQSNAAIGYTAGAAASAASLYSTSDTVIIRATAKDSVTVTFSVTNSLGNMTFSVSSANNSIETTLAAGYTTLGTLTWSNINAGDTITVTVNGGQAKQTTDNSLQFQIGANTAQTLGVGFNDMSAQAIGVKNGNTYVDVSTQAGAMASVSQIDAAITKVSSERSKLGAFQNRLEHTINNLGTSSENLTAAESRIRDVDMAKEMMSFQKTNIISQAATAMLAQANQAPQGVLQLLR